MRDDTSSVVVFNSHSFYKESQGIRQRVLQSVSVEHDDNPAECLFARQHLVRVYSGTETETETQLTVLDTDRALVEDNRFRCVHSA